MSGDSHSLPARLRQLAGTALEIAQVRLALLGNELQTQSLGLVLGLGLALGGVLVLLLAAVLLCALVLLLAGEQHRLSALIGLLAVALAGGAWLLHAAARTLQGLGSPFAATLEELQRDREALAGGAAEDAS